jgi:hypothetical protein
MHNYMLIIDLIIGSKTWCTSFISCELLDDWNNLKFIWIVDYIVDQQDHHHYIQ